MNQGVKTALIVGGIILAVLIIIPSIFGTNWGGQSSGFGMMGGMMGGFGGMGLMAILWLVVIGVIIWAIVAAVQNSTQSKSSSSPPADSALDVLKKRYARGEIDNEEFMEKKKELV